MLTIGCLGTANYWMTLPLFSIVGALAVLSIVSPRTARRLPGRSYSDGWMRVVGLVVLVAVIGMGSLAVQEARTDPECKMEGSAAR